MRKSLFASTWNVTDELKGVVYLLNKPRQDLEVITEVYSELGMISNVTIDCCLLQPLIYYDFFLDLLSGTHVTECSIRYAVSYLILEVPPKNFTIKCFIEYASGKYVESWKSGVRTRCHFVLKKIDQHYFL